MRLLKCANKVRLRSVVLEEFHKVVVWLLKENTSTANETINSLIFVLKLAAKLLCITKKVTAYI